MYRSQYQRDFYIYSVQNGPVTILIHGWKISKLHFSFLETIRKLYLRKHSKWKKKCKKITWNRSFSIYYSTIKSNIGFWLSDLHQRCEVECETYILTDSLTSDLAVTSHPMINDFLIPATKFLNDNIEQNYT